jgi:hypothetical protein
MLMINLSALALWAGFVAAIDLDIDNERKPFQSLK